LPPCVSRWPEALFCDLKPPNGGDRSAKELCRPAGASALTGAPVSTGSRHVAIGVPPLPGLLATHCGVAPKKLILADLSFYG
jgi:hypothetical protein